MYLQLKDCIAVPSTNIGNHSKLQQKIAKWFGRNSSGGIAASGGPWFDSRQGKDMFSISQRPERL
jgi:hypothetical protein